MISDRLKRVLGHSSPVNALQSYIIVKRNNQTLFITAEGSTTVAQVKVEVAGAIGASTESVCGV